MQGRVRKESRTAGASQSEESGESRPAAADSPVAETAIASKPAPAASLLSPALEVSSKAFLDPADLEARGLSGQTALGLIETRGFLPLVIATDAAAKAADVSLVRYDKVLGGMVAVCVVGDIGATRVAVDSGVAAARDVGEVVASVVLANPAREVVSFFFTGERSGAGEADLRGPSALGFVETRGLVTAVSAMDAMLKSARVTFLGYENSGSGAVTAIVRGELAAVKHAVAAGAAGARSVGEVAASYVLTKLQRDLEAPFLLGPAGRLAPTSGARRLPGQTG